MIPKLYSARETEFTTLGLGVLSDCQKCTVTESRNGEYILEMDYPISGANYEQIKNDTIILAKSNDKHQEQPFRVTRISKPIGGIVSIQAEHISYKTRDLVIEPFNAGSAAEAASGMNSNSVGYNPFIFSTDKNTLARFNVLLPQSYRELMGGTRGSLLDVYGGEYEYDRFNIYLRGSRGNDKGVVIEYGKNLTDLNQDESIANLITAVYPFWNDGDSGLVSLPEKTIEVENPQSVFPRIQVLDLSGEFEDAPTIEELRKATQSYVDSTDLKTPGVSITASFEYLWQMEEYKDDPTYKAIAALERVNLCDVVTVRFAALGVDATAKIVSVTYNVLLEKYDRVEIGESRTNLTSTLAEQQTALGEAPTTTELQQAINNATNQITGATGGYIVLDPPKSPQRILIMDTPDKATATRVWQWNLNGLGYSNSGINGPYGIAITQDGAIVADYITAGTMSANIIRAGTITDAAGNSIWNLDAGTFDMKGKITTRAVTIAGNSYHTVLNGSVLTVYANDIAIGRFGVEEYTTGVYRMISWADIYRGTNYRLYDSAKKVDALFAYINEATGVPSYSFNGPVYLSTQQLQIGGNVAKWTNITINGTPYTVLTG